METVSPTAQQLLDRIRGQLGSTFGCAELRAFVHTTRGKPLIVETIPMRADRTGFAASLQDCDLVYVAAGLDDIQRLGSCLHEFVHVLRGDATPLHHVRYHTFTAARERFMQDGVYREHGSGDDDPVRAREQDIEQLARILLRVVLPVEQQRLSITRMFFV